MGRTMSIDQEGGIAVHINRFFQSRGSNKDFQAVLQLKELKIGKRHVSMQRQADELGVSRAVLYKWHDLIDKNKAS